MGGRIGIALAVMVAGTSADAAPPVDGGSSDGQVGGLTREQLLAAVREHVEEIRECAKRGEPRPPSFQAKVVLGATIDPDGGVKAPRTVSSTLKEPATERCMLDRMAQWRFPATGREHPLVLPFGFQGGVPPGLDRPDFRRAALALGSGRLHRALRFGYGGPVMRRGGMTDREVMAVAAVEMLVGHLDRAELELEWVTAESLRAAALNNRSNIARLRGEGHRELELLHAAETVDPDDCAIANGLALARMRAGTSPSEAIASSQARCPTTDPFRHVASAAATLLNHDPRGAAKEIAEAARLAQAPLKRRELVDEIAFDPLFAALRDRPDVRAISATLWAGLATSAIDDLRVEQRGLPPATLELAEICADFPACTALCPPLWEWLASGSQGQPPGACPEAGSDPATRDAFVRAQLTRWATAQRAPLDSVARSRLDCALGRLGLQPLASSCN